MHNIAVTLLHLVWIPFRFLAGPGSAIGRAPDS